MILTVILAFFIYDIFDIVFKMFWAAHLTLVICSHTRLGQRNLAVRVSYFLGSTGPAYGAAYLVLSTANAALKCLVAAAPLASSSGIAWPGEQGDDSLAAVLSLRVLDWAFRRIEADRPEVILCVHWRLGSCRLLWDFLSACAADAGRAEIEDTDDLANQDVPLDTYHLGAIDLHINKGIYKNI